MLIGQGKGRKAAQWGRLLHSPVGSGELPWSSGYGGDREEGIQLERDPPRVGKNGSIAIPSITRRGQHSHRKCQPHRELGVRTTGQRFGMLCNDQPKENRLPWGTEQGQRTLAGAAIRSLTEKGRKVAPTTASNMAGRHWLWEVAKGLGALLGWERSLRFVSDLLCAAGMPQPLWASFSHPNSD